MLPLFRITNQTVEGRLMFQLRNQLFRESKLRDEKHSRPMNVKSTVKRLMVRRAISLVVFAPMVWAISSLPSFDVPSSPVQNYSAHYSLPGSRSFSTSLSLTLSSAPCTLATPYQDQPIAECQTAYDIHRITVFLIASQSLIVLLLGALLIMQFRASR